MKVFKRKSTQGFALIGIIAIIVAVVGVAGAAYYVMNRDKDGETSQLTNQEQKQVEAECKKEIDDKDFCKFASNWSFGGEYKITMSTSGGSEVGSFVSEVDGENSSTVVTSADGEESRFIYLEGASYVYDPSNSVWMKYPAAAESVESLAEDFSDNFDFDNTDVPEAERQTYESQGKEACGNLTCFKYQIKDPANPAFESFIWFDDDEYKMRRFMTSENGATTDATIEYVGVTISEPSPVQEYSQPEGVPSEAELQEMLNSLQQ